MSTASVTARGPGVNLLNLYSVSRGKAGASASRGVVTTRGVVAMSTNPPRGAG